MSKQKNNLAKETKTRQFEKKKHPKNLTKTSCRKNQSHTQKKNPNFARKNKNKQNHL